METQSISFGFGETQNRLIEKPVINETPFWNMQLAHKK